MQEIYQNILNIFLKNIWTWKGPRAAPDPLARGPQVGRACCMESTEKMSPRKEEEEEQQQQEEEEGKNKHKRCSS